MYRYAESEAEKLKMVVDDEGFRVPSSEAASELKAACDCVRKRLIKMLFPTFPTG